MVTTPKKTKLFFKNQGKNSPKQESLVFLEATVHRMREKAENQRKTRKKSKVAENKCFGWIFCTKKACSVFSVHTPQKEKKRENSECEGKRKGKRRGLCEGNRSISRKI